MLVCQDLRKTYLTGQNEVHALKGISLSFRSQEFVSILGPSGCGKTTLLNIIGGLDQCSQGQLIIDGIKTQDYTARDWDIYRNHRIGFVFQNYHLIAHQSVLANVELAMTLSGISKKERQEKAKAVLARLGLADKLSMRPNQLSGGQQQRVAIARALVNDPDILLADEPTGALDSETSFQIMDLLQEISQEKLVIMVTHNPELAQQYSSRIIQLKDGLVVEDSHPYDETYQTRNNQSMKTAMPLSMAISLSFSNLMTKKGRTFLTSFAGSIGIIGIALIISLSHGMQAYVDQVQNDTMAAYPIRIEGQSLDMGSLMNAMMGISLQGKSHHQKDRVYTRPLVADILNSVSSSKKNNLKAFKAYLSSKKGKAFKKVTKAIEYEYALQLLVYNPNSEAGLVKVSPNGMLERMGLSNTLTAASNASLAQEGKEVWNKLPSSQRLREDSFQLVSGHWATNENEVVLAIDLQHEISDYALYSLGLMNQDTLVQSYRDFTAGDIDKVQKSKVRSYRYDELINQEFKLLVNTDVYEKVNGVWVDQSHNQAYMKQVVDSAQTVKVVGIIQPKEAIMGKTFYGGVYYPDIMEKKMIERLQQSPIVQEQLAHPEINVLSGQPFGTGAQLDPSQLDASQQAALAHLSPDQLVGYLQAYQSNVSLSYQAVLQKLGVVDLANPSAISLYVDSFEQKQQLNDLIDQYNSRMSKAGHENKVISYNDWIGTMLKSVTGVITMISYILIGFVSVSLVVSSLMIGIITYISVLERIREIGILRALGASQKDVARVFRAETCLIGFSSGLLGIIVTLLLNWPISYLVQKMTGVSNLAQLPWSAALVLIVLSLFLTLLSGWIPAAMAAKKDPVLALHSE